MLNKFLFPQIRPNYSKLKKALAGKKVLLTGASFGVGKQTAIQLAPYVKTLVLCARSEEELILLKEELKVFCSVYIKKIDLRSELERKKWISDLKEQNLQPDILIHNAGHSIKRSLWESKNRLHDYQRTMDINYEAPVHLSLEFLEHLSKAKGKIIHISAINTRLTPAPKWSAYQSSKTAFDQWVRSCRPELKAKNIKAISLYFPLIKTRMITANKSYEKMPAMSAQHAAQWIIKACYQKRTTKAPWWFPFAKSGSFFLGWTIPLFYKSK